MRWSGDDAGQLAPVYPCHSGNTPHRRPDPSSRRLGSTLQQTPSGPRWFDTSSARSDIVKDKTSVHPDQAPGAWPVPREAASGGTGRSPIDTDGKAEILAITWTSCGFARTCPQSDSSVRAPRRAADSRPTRDPSKGTPLRRRYRQPQPIGRDPELAGVHS